MMIADQATKLRRMAADVAESVAEAETVQKSASPRVASPKRHSSARTIAVTSGKGGVGKSNISLNLAISAARLGHRVVVMDADFGLANVDVLANVRSRYNLSHLINGSHGIMDILSEGPEGVRIIPGASGLAGLADMTETQRDRLLAQMEQIDTMADLLIIDTAAGISRNVINFLSAADDVLVVATPEPTSIIDSYATVKVLSQEADYGYIHLALNMVSGREEAEAVSAHFLRVANDFLKVSVNYAGYVERDEALESAVRSRVPLLVQHPNSTASQNMAALLRGLGVHKRSERDGRDGFFRRFFSFLSK